MAMLADRVDGISGVDTHRDTLTAALSRRSVACSESWS